MEALPRQGSDLQQHPHRHLTATTKRTAKLELQHRIYTYVFELPMHIYLLLQQKRWKMRPRPHCWSPRSPSTLTLMQRWISQPSTGNSIRPPLLAIWTQMIQWLIAIEIAVTPEVRSHGLFDESTSTTETPALTPALVTGTSVRGDVFDRSKHGSRLWFTVGLTSTENSSTSAPCPGIRGVHEVGCTYDAKMGTSERKPFLQDQRRFMRSQSRLYKMQTRTDSTAKAPSCTCSVFVRDHAIRYPFSNWLNSNRWLNVYTFNRALRLVS